MVGCGKIGSLLDEGLDSGVVLSHAGAYQRSGRVRLAALCDANKERLSECGRTRGVSALYLDYRAMLVSERIDVLSVCTPTEERLPILEAAFEAGVGVIFCEKPVAYGLTEAREMKSLADQFHGVVAIDYMRRWDPGINEAAQLIDSGQIGPIQHVTAYYGKGILNNGSHIIDLLNLFVGLPRRVRVSRAIDDGQSALDPTLDCVLEYEADLGRFPGYLIASDHRHFSLFELDIVGAAGRVRIAEKGQEIRFYAVGEDPTFPGYSTLIDRETVPGDLRHALAYAVEDVIDVFEGRSRRPKCSIEEGIEKLTSEA